MTQCSICLGEHTDADCPATYARRTVRALERIVELLEKQQKPAPPAVTP